MPPRQREVKKLDTKKRVKMAAKAFLQQPKDSSLPKKKKKKKKDEAEPHVEYYECFKCEKTFKKKEKFLRHLGRH